VMTVDTATATQPMMGSFLFFIIFTVPNTDTYYFTSTRITEINGTLRKYSI